MNEREEHVISESVPVIATLWREGDEWVMELRVWRTTLISRHATRDEALEYARRYCDVFVMP